ncbi:hypothetical protein ACFFIS_08215 [Virgibacillus soli]|uniref:hypothetical protein n=1 Tax=Paracerasibacillus soli TaxID=480284 RepID=UPI0035E7EB54
MRLYPHEVIEYMIAGGMILFLLIIAAILYWGKKLKFGFYISTVVLIGVITFFIIRPFWIEHQINKKSIALEEYLQAQYPDTTWTISAINFRGNKTQNPYYLLVEFSDDPGNIYYYYVYKDGSTKQMGGESGGSFLSDQKYYEPDEDVPYP